MTAVVPDAPVSGRQLIERAAVALLDPQGREVAAAVQWWQLPGLDGGSSAWPVAVAGDGSPVLLLHGFDSSCLEFRRLLPLLRAQNQVFVPDLFGFGFCPRPAGAACGPELVLRHLEAVVDALLLRSGAAQVGLIGASMGGSVAVELPSPARRFAVVSQLLSVRFNRRLRFKVLCSDDEEPMVDSLVPVWASANWFEREAFDLFGILFKGHPDLRRLLTDYGFIGHPFRKDFPLIGNVEVRYDPIKQRVVYEPVTIEPRTLVPRVVRHDNRYDPSLIESGPAGGEGR